MRFDGSLKLKEVVINPKMDEKALQEIVETTRKIIIELYLKCENDFLEGLERGYGSA